MREHVHSAALRRDQRLAQVRRLTLWIGGGAAAASLALGTVFAHSIPGHAASTGTTGSGGQPATGGTAHSGQSTQASQGTARHRHHHRLARPASNPAPAPAPPPVVTSGGS